MATNTEIRDRRELTNVNELLRNLAGVLRASNARISYLASAALEPLARLRATAAERGFVQFNLLNPPWLHDPELALINRTFMNSLDELVDALRSYRSIWPLDPRVAAAASKIQEAYESLNQAGSIVKHT